MKRTILQKDGETKVAWVEKIANKLWVHMDGQTWTYQPQTKKRKTSTEDKLDGNITSPMPGKILKVHAEKGQSVREGEELVVLEAMKMEYSLKAPFDGTVEDIKISESQQVGLGEKLVFVQAMDGSDEN